MVTLTYTQSSKSSGRAMINKITDSAAEALVGVKDGSSKQPRTRDGNNQSCQLYHGLQPRITCMDSIPRRFQEFNFWRRVISVRLQNVGDSDGKQSEFVGNLGLEGMCGSGSRPRQGRSFSAALGPARSTQRSTV